MKPAGLILLLLGCVTTAHAQHIFKAKVTDEFTGQALAGANASILNQPRAVADEKGFLTVTAIPEGEFEIEFSFIGYEAQKMKYSFPLPNAERIFTIALTPVSKKLREVAVSTTRSSKAIADIPTRIEMLKGEMLEERSNMRPADIRMLLNESTGIHMQQTSATSFNSGIRIHGLDGRYTQILRDGFPLYSGFASGLSVLQIAPLDLRQVEIIKGSASTLYGGGAISGLVNLISRTPQDKKLTVLLNGTSALGIDVSAFYAQRFDNMGATLFASRNSNWAYDPAGNGLTAIPEYERYTFNPGLFFYLNDKTQLNVALNSTVEDRIGGDTQYIRGEGDSVHAYFEKSLTDRVSSQVVLRHQFNENSLVTVKNSIGFFKRRTEMQDYRFSGMQLSSFSEASWQRKSKKLEWILGINEWTDKFTEDKSDTIIARDYHQFTVGAFAQNTWSIARWLTLETGLRGDYQNDYGFFVLPRFSALFKISSKVTARAGGGLGYRTPTVFTDDAERIQYKKVLPVDVAQADAERSIGGNLDVNYYTSLFNKQGSLNINQLVFYTRINEPVELVETASGNYEYLPQDGCYDSKGTETNLRLKYKNFVWVVGYTFADAKKHFSGTTADVPLSAKHRLNGIFMYEVKDNFRVGFEAYLTGRQRLSDNTKSRSYWICGVIFEKMWEHVSVFVNCENMLNVRQTKYETIYSGTITHPTFRDIYAPLDGVVANAGVKIML